jgi:hypothetical protein
MGMNNKLCRALVPFGRGRAGAAGGRVTARPQGFHCDVPERLTGVHFVNRGELIALCSAELSIAGIELVDRGGRLVLCVPFFFYFLFRCARRTICACRGDDDPISCR